MNPPFDHSLWEDVVVIRDELDEREEDGGQEEQRRQGAELPRVLRFHLRRLGDRQREDAEV